MNRQGNEQATHVTPLGDKIALTATVAPADAGNKKVRWSVATDALTVYVKVDNKAQVGRANKITVASDADGSKSATCDITFIASKEKVVASTNVVVPHVQKEQEIAVTATSPKPALQPVKNSAPKPATQTEMTVEK